ncbi:hypothetical protein F8388_009841 [Cannabis sativa]|uniref:CCHC-type domain-containing protein n=1 Tax=Cannabis sativa TaxID=3483 RepID=A0A7J6H4L3_CANSA|nr:hypothetical protein G4B88_024047 [Cannabis sativa]KAF4389708.1 hypothetical protein F8388_009841 [Cannabis sativa]
MGDELKHLTALADRLNVDEDEIWDSNEETAQKEWKKEVGWSMEIIAKEKGCTVVGLSFEDKVLAEKTYKKSTCIFMVILFKFENLPILCYSCGCFGHEKNDCGRDVAKVKHEMGDMVLLYGNWLKEDNRLSSCFNLLKLTSVVDSGREQQLVGTIQS